MSETVTRVIDVEALVEIKNPGDVIVVTRMTITIAVAIISLHVATIETVIVIIEGHRPAVVNPDRTATESKLKVLTCLVALTRQIPTILGVEEKLMTDVLAKNANNQRKCILTSKRSR